MRASTIMALAVGLCGENTPSPFDDMMRSRPVWERDKAKLDQRHVADAKAKAEAKRARKAAKRR